MRMPLSFNSSVYPNGRGRRLKPVSPPAAGIGNCDLVHATFGREDTFRGHATPRHGARSGMLRNAVSLAATVRIHDYHGGGPGPPRAAAHGRRICSEIACSSISRHPPMGRARLHPTTVRCSSDRPLRASRMQRPAGTRPASRRSAAFHRARFRGGRTTRRRRSTGACS